jgi:peptidoglycan/xylan/chitin deacetylase (PgdA/CDA1 family)
MAGKLVVSLDFELMWGVRDHRTTRDYGDAVLGGRRAIPEMLRRFEAAGVRATWATVGLLFARNRDEMLAYAPQVKPSYENEGLSPYAAISDQIGEDEQTDPLHYGRSLIDQIRSTEGQEIATHTYSHYYCLEPGQTADAFDADIQSAVRIAAEAGVRLSSIVFPRNQMTDVHIGICASHGITAFRGNQGGIAYQSRPQSGNTLWVRGMRFADGVLPVTGRSSYPWATADGRSVDVRASRFLRPFSPRLSVYHDLHVKQVIRELRSAAARGEVYHLWWHPHNMGEYTERQLAGLDRILNEYRSLRDEYGFSSATMQEMAASSPVS